MHINVSRLVIYEINIYFRELREVLVHCQTIREESKRRWGERRGEVGETGGPMVISACR